MQAMPAGASLAHQSPTQAARPATCANPTFIAAHGQQIVHSTHQPAGVHPWVTRVTGGQTILHSTRVAQPLARGTTVAGPPSIIHKATAPTQQPLPQVASALPMVSCSPGTANGQPGSVPTVGAYSSLGSVSNRPLTSYTAGRPAPVDVQRTACAPAQLQIVAGAFTLCGQKSCAPGQPNQDTYLTVPLGPGLMLAGVLDGHGKRGHLVSAYVCKIFESCALQFANLPAPEIPQAFTKMFAVAQEGLVRDGLANMNGTTATLALINANAGTITAAHVGDSTLAVFAGLNVASCTRNHIVDDEVERYVVAHGGEVYEQTFAGVTAKRMYPPGEDAVGLAMARALGHSELVPLVLTVPEITTAQIGAGCTVVVASDGIWEKMTTDSVATFVAGATPIVNNAQAETVAHALVTEARSRWPSPPDGDVDDITAVVLRVVP